MLGAGDFWRRKLSICSNDWTGAGSRAAVALDGGDGNGGGGEKGMGTSKLSQFSRGEEGMERGNCVLFAFN